MKLESDENIGMTMAREKKLQACNLERGRSTHRTLLNEQGKNERVDVLAVLRSKLLGSEALNAQTHTTFKSRKRGIAFNFTRNITDFKSKIEGFGELRVKRLTYHIPKENSTNIRQTAFQRRQDGTRRLPLKD